MLAFCDVCGMIDAIWYKYHYQIINDVAASTCLSETNVMVITGIITIGCKSRVTASLDIGEIELRFDRLRGRGIRTYFKKHLLKVIS